MEVTCSRSFSRHVSGSRESLAASLSTMWKLLCLSAILSTGLAASIPPGQQSLIVVLVDGVRADYLNDTSLQLRGFPRIASEGVRAKYVTPVVPSNSYPNWYTITTGLYPEYHGMVQNYMYDADRNDYFLMSPHPNVSHPHWWNYAEPLWVTAENAGAHTAMYWWDGCQVEIRGRMPTYCAEYRTYGNWSSVNKDTQDALSKALEQLGKGVLRLAMVYYEGVDANGHGFGPDSEERKQALKDIDLILYNLLDEIKNRNLEDRVNVVVLSDHGMTDSDPSKMTHISLDEYLDTDDIQLVLGAGSLSMILPVEGKEEKVYKDLDDSNVEGLSVYKKSNVPPKYHYRAHPLIFPVMVFADKGYIIEPLNDPSKMKPLYNNTAKGSHGYDPFVVQDMRTIFYATGPSFKKNYMSSPINMVDHYNLMCHALGIQPLQNNGSWANVEGMIASSSPTILENKQTLIIPLMLIFYLLTSL